MLVSVSLGLPVLWLTWATYRESRRFGQDGDLGLAEIADQLAIAVGAQWEAEAAVRRLNDPYPLPVSWVAADPSLTDSWDLLVKLAMTGAGRSANPPTDNWATGPDELAGAGGDLMEALVRVPTGRLVVLGEPGAGKTMLMVRLVLDLLARRSGGAPVPILVSIASWNPKDQKLRDWLAARLVIDYPALAAAAPTGREEPSRVAALLASGLILPILDGLDEIAKEVRGEAIRSINDALLPDEPLVLTCRREDYRDAIRPRKGAEVTLRGAAAVNLRPLNPAHVSGYLCDDAGGPVAKARWAPVLSVLGTEAPVGRALETPLMVSLARAIYNPRPGELTAMLRDPAELCAPALPDQKAVQFLLFDAFVAAAYRNALPGNDRTQAVERWLAFLARHLVRMREPDLAWWKLSLAMPGFRRAVRIVTGILAGVAAGTIVVAFFGGVIVLRWIAFRGAGKTLEILFSVPIAVIGLMGAVLVGILSGLKVSESMEGFVAPSALGSAMTPRTILKRDRRATIVGGIVFGALIGVLVSVPLGVISGFVQAFAWGGASWIVAGFISGYIFFAWPSYEITRIWLALHHQLPWRLMSFLEDAHSRGVLRQTGAVYQFRHVELQRRLAGK